MAAPPRLGRTRWLEGMVAAPRRTLAGDSARGRGPWVAGRGGALAFRPSRPRLAARSNIHARVPFSGAMLSSPVEIRIGIVLRGLIYSIKPNLRHMVWYVLPEVPDAPAGCDTRTIQERRLLHAGGGASFELLPSAGQQRHWVPPWRGGCAPHRLVERLKPLRWPAN